MKEATGLLLIFALEDKVTVPVALDVIEEVCVIKTDPLALDVNAEDDEIERSVLVLGIDEKEIFALLLNSDDKDATALLLDEAVCNADCEFVIDISALSVIALLAEFVNVATFVALCLALFVSIPEN